MARALMWRAAFVLAMAVGGLMTALIWPLARCLTLLCDAMDQAEMRWLLACSDRRVAERRRVNVADQIRPLPGGRDDRQ